MPRSVKQMCRGHICSAGTDTNRSKYSVIVREPLTWVPYGQILFGLPSCVFRIIEIPLSAESDQGLCPWNPQAFFKRLDRKLLSPKIETRIKTLTPMIIGVFLRHVKKERAAQWVFGSSLFPKRLAGSGAEPQRSQSHNHSIITKHQLQLVLHALGHVGGTENGHAAA